MFMTTHDRPTLRFVRYSWLVLVLNIAVIVWGGFVSASGSGDGCGTDWPLCGNLTAAESTVTARETAIEFIHRGTSGLALLAVIGLLLWARRRFAAGHPARRAALWSFIFIVIESLLGAALVIFAWVDTNESLARAFVQPVHLLNTFLLLGALGLTAWWGSGRAPVVLRGNRRAALLLGGALLGLVVLGMFGTLASLASTIFPSESFLAGVQRDFARDEHWLIRLRIWHPIVATALGGYLFALRRALLPTLPADTAAEPLSAALLALFAVQYALGGLNAVLLTPVWLQLVHLFLTDVLWLLALFLAATVLAQAPARQRLAAAVAAD